MVRPRAKAVATLGATEKGAGSGIWVSHAAGVAVAVGQGCSRAGRREASGRKQCCPPQPRLLTLDLAFHPAEAGGGWQLRPAPSGGGRAGLGGRRAAPASSSRSNSQCRAGFSLVLINPEEEVSGRQTVWPFAFQIISYCKVPSPAFLPHPTPCQRKPPLGSGFPPNATAWFDFS